MSIELFEDQFVSLADDTELVEQFSCMVCLGVAVNPCKCDKCNTVYCRKCIPEKYWLGVESDYWNDLKYQCFKMCGSQKLIPLTKIERMVLDSLKFRCQHEAEGCEKELKYSEIREHLKNDCVNKIEIEEELPIEITQKKVEVPLKPKAAARAPVAPVDPLEDVDLGELFEDDDDREAIR